MKKNLAHAKIPSMLSPENSIEITMVQPLAHAASEGHTTIAARAVAVWGQIEAHLGKGRAQLSSLNAGDNGSEPDAHLIIGLPSEVTPAQIKAFLEEKNIPGLSFPEPEAENQE